MKRWTVILVGWAVLPAVLAAASPPAPAGEEPRAVDREPTAGPGAAAESPAVSSEPAAGPGAEVALPAGERELGAFALRRALRDAERARREGRLEEARERYLQVLAATRQGEPRRGRALYGLAATDLALGSDSSLDEARAALVELLSRHAGQESHQEAATLAGLLARVDDAGKARDDAERRRRDLEAACAATAAVLAAELEAVRAGDGEDAAEIEGLAARLTAAQAELARLREEMERKDRALERLKRTLVEQGGRP